MLSVFENDKIILLLSLYLSTTVCSKITNYTPTFCTAGLAPLLCLALSVLQNPIKTVYGYILLHFKFSQANDDENYLQFEACCCL